jgi:hypothetical protein
MHKLTIRLIVALLTFILGIVATTVWFINRRSSHQEVRQIIPKTHWEPDFFRSLDEYTKRVNLPRLRTVVLPQDDLEVRLWFDALPERIDGVILRRTANQWAAIYLLGKQPGFQIKQQVLAAPKSGWEATWNRLVNAGILTLPDASEVQCKSEALDGIGYVVETNVNKTYRTYRYGNPQLAKCNEARQMVEIANIMEEEFSLWTSPS